MRLAVPQTHACLILAACFVVGCSGIERGEEVDVFAMFNGIAAHVDDLQRQGK